MVMAASDDAAFWRRFSSAAQQDEEEQQSPHAHLQLQNPNEIGSPDSSASADSPFCSPDKQTDGGSETPGRERARRMALCWIFWVCLFGLVTGIVLVVLWMRAKVTLAQGQAGD